jgi:hypothetical protein
LAASVSTNGSTAHRQGPDPASANRRKGLDERILCSLLVATVPFGSVLTDAPKVIMPTCPLTPVVTAAL